MNPENSGFLLLFLIGGISLFLNGVLGLILGEMRIVFMRGMEATKITGGWSTIVSIIFLLAGIGCAATGIFLDTSESQLGQGCAIFTACCGVIIFVLVLFIAANEGAKARD